MDLSDITLVIFSYNRQHCLKATLQFYQDTSLNLLVLDNSPRALEQRYIPQQCNYIHSKTSFAARSILAESLIKTPYTIIGADDEIYIPSSLEVMMQFLEDNQDYVAVGGCALAVWKYGNYIAGSWAYRRTFKYHNYESTPFERIKKHTGGGAAPLTSFFTCNLTRSETMKNCLVSYGESPVLSTDAISVLTICGAGKSKYLDVLYWIRNWNQSPRSHSNWNRRVFLHNWWEDPINVEQRSEFTKQLRKAYSENNNSSTFDDSWNLILKSDSILQSRTSILTHKIRKFNEIPIFIWLKYLIKFSFFPSSLPTNSAQEVEEMKNKGVHFSNHEVFKAINTVSKLRPYKKW